MNQSAAAQELQRLFGSSFSPRGTRSTIISTNSEQNMSDPSSRRHNYKPAPPVSMNKSTFPQKDAWERFSDLESKLSAANARIRDLEFELREASMRQESERANLRRETRNVEAALVRTRDEETTRLQACLGQVAQLEAERKDLIIKNERLAEEAAELAAFVEVFREEREREQAQWKELESEFVEIYEKKQQEASQLEAAISAVERRAAEENAAKTTEIANLEKRFAAEVEAVKQEHAREIEQAEQRLEQRLVSAQAVESAKATQITRDIENALNERDRSTELRVAAEGAYEGLRTEFERQVQGNRNLHKALAEVRAQYAETEANMRSELAENLAKAQEAHQTEAQAMSAALEKTIEELENDKYKSDCRGIELEERLSQADERDSQYDIREKRLGRIQSRLRLELDRLFLRFHDFQDYLQTSVSGASESKTSVTVGNQGCDVFPTTAMFPHSGAEQIGSNSRTTTLHPESAESKMVPSVSSSKTIALLEQDRHKFLDPTGFFVQELSSLASLDVADQLAFLHDKVCPRLRVLVEQVVIERDATAQALQRALVSYFGGDALAIPQSGAGGLNYTDVGNRTLEVRSDFISTGNENERPVNDVPSFSSQAALARLEADNLELRKQLGRTKFDLEAATKKLKAASMLSPVVALGSGLGEHHVTPTTSRNTGSVSIKSPPLICEAESDGGGGTALSASGVGASRVKRPYATPIPTTTTPSGSNMRHVDHMGHTSSNDRHAVASSKHTRSEATGVELSSIQNRAKPSGTQYTVASHMQRYASQLSRQGSFPSVPPGLRHKNKDAEGTVDDERTKRTMRARSCGITAQSGQLTRNTGSHNTGSESVDALHRADIRDLFRRRYIGLNS